MTDVHLKQHKVDYTARLPQDWRRNPSVLAADKIWSGQNVFASKGVLVQKLKLWWHPPEVSYTITSPPQHEQYFRRRLFLWVPCHLWKWVFRCPQCNLRDLTLHHLYKTVKLVLDVSSYYYLATEYLDCNGCRTSFAAWDSRLLSQLPGRYLSEFPVVQTYRSACHHTVMEMLRGRTLGNSSTALQQRIHELHSECHLRSCLSYLDDCRRYKNYCTLYGKPVPQFDDPQPFRSPLSARWLLSCYVRDVYARMPLIQASLTSTSGQILKMDSTKKVCKKLQGAIAGAANWMTSVSNEVGQVLISVLTTSEDRASLRPLADGLMQRYITNSWKPPILMYIDKDCCVNDGPSHIQALFHGWPELQVRLDIWHFMRRLAVGCVSEAHPLYATFMSRLSGCLFVVDAADYNLLKRAKRAELAKKGATGLSERAVVANISRKEVLRHCKRATRGEEKTIELIDELLFTMKTRMNLLGESLFSEQIDTIWQVEKRHVKCLQDPDGISLYTKTGTIIKGDIELPEYRCARGSTSLESFHLHLCRFIPGTAASALNYQAFLLEGLSRWNEDRATASLQGPQLGEQFRSFNTRLKMQVEMLLV